MGLFGNPVDIEYDVDNKKIKIGKKKYSAETKKERKKADKQAKKISKKHGIRSFRVKDKRRKHNDVTYKRKGGNLWEG